MAEEADNIMDRYIRARAKRIASDPKDAANAHYQLGVAIALLDHLLIQRGDLARIEVPASELSRLASAKVASELVARLKSLGFRYITLDLEGFRSGSMNGAAVTSTAPAASGGSMPV